ncbi:MAG: FGGY-family carbohydrate kinase [Deltaproteobacteria bacterium]|nr:FGGY-family carbohydrate kinase [Candidatus Zymogenaceae bacterium]
MTDKFYIGVDVGTGSARAGLFDGNGKMRGMAAHPIEMSRPENDFVEQSSENIWRMVCRSVRDAMSEAGVDGGRIGGMGFDATCSLVAVDADDGPVSVSPTGDDRWNVIVWMDHRAISETEEINRMGHPVLQYVGGVISPEMQTPKLLWLKRNLPDAWRRAARFFDLPDYLTYRATGFDTRSLCSIVCKWTYLGRENRWDDDYFSRAGLGDLSDEGYRRIGTRIRPMGEPVGEGLSRRAADELGLSPGTPVGVSIIDAHAGGVGLLGMTVDGRALSPDDFERRLALIGGTSTCHMAVSTEPRFIPGVWGPYYGAMIPGMWLTEGGQSATGSLIDHVIFSHSASAPLAEEAKAAGTTIYELLNRRLDRLSETASHPGALTEELHVLPYFHGNRSPRADATLRGAVCGLRLSDTADDLALVYLAAVQAVAYGTRHIIEEMNTAGYAVDTVIACGGGTKNRVFLREHANSTGCRIVLGAEPEAVLLGSAVLGAVAGGDFPTIMEAMAAMESPGEVIGPEAGAVRDYHDRKYRVFHRMYDDFMAYRVLMRQ